MARCVSELMPIEKGTGALPAGEPAVGPIATDTVDVTTGRVESD